VSPSKSEVHSVSSKKNLPFLFGALIERGAMHMLTHASEHVLYPELYPYLLFFLLCVF
jgi:hypothetical protein